MMNLKSLVSIFAVLLGSNLSSFAQSSLIVAGRSIAIELRGVPPDEMTRVTGKYNVSDSGYITLPYINNIRAAGLTPAQLGENIASAYKNAQIYTTPTVNVQATSIQDIQKLQVHLGGSVRRTGPVEFTEGLTIYQAIQAAGGPTEFGAMNRVVLSTSGKVRTLDLEKIQFQSYVLKSGDTVTVPEKNIWGR